MGLNHSDPLEHSGDLQLEVLRTAQQWGKLLMEKLEETPYQEESALHCIKKWGEQCRIEGIDVNEFEIDTRDFFNPQDGLAQAVLEKCGDGLVAAQEGVISEEEIPVPPEKMETLMEAFWEEGVQVDNVKKEIKNIDDMPRHQKNNQYRAWGGMTILQISCRLGLESLAQKCLNKGASVDPTLPTGRTALMFTAWGGHIQLMQKLIRLGADLNTQCSMRGDSAVHWATEKSQLKALELLLQSGAHVNLKDQRGRSALNKIPYFKSADPAGLIRCLIQYDIELDDQDNNGETACHKSVMEDHLDSIKLLMAAGANMELKSKLELTPIEMAKAYSYPSIEAYLTGALNAKKDKVLLGEVVTLSAPSGEHKKGMVRKKSI